MASKLAIALELERRGALPENKQNIVNELRRRGLVPPLPVSQPPDNMSQFASEGMPPGSASPSIGEFFQGLLTNRPTSGVGSFLGRNLPALAGGALGAAAGVGAASIPLAGLGGASFEAGRQGLVNIASALGSGESFTPPSQVLGETIKSGVSQAIGQGAGVGLGAVKGWTGQALKRPAAQMIKVLTGTPERAATSALSGNLLGAPTKSEAGSIYEQIFAEKGLQSLGSDPVSATGKNIPTIADYNRLFETAMNKLNKGTINLQEAIYGSQSAAKLQALAKFGSPVQAVAKTSIAKGKTALDSLIEEKLPGYATARSLYAAAQTREAFSNALPLNANLSPNVLRSYAGVAGGLGALAHGNPLLALLPLAQSPLLVGGAIRGGQFLGRNINPTFFGRTAAQTIANFSGEK